MDKNEWGTGLVMRGKSNLLALSQKFDRACVFARIPIAKFSIALKFVNYVI